MARDFTEIWDELKRKGGKKRVVYTFETRKMQVIEEINDNGFLVNDDPTHKKVSLLVDVGAFERAYSALVVRKAIPRGDLINLVGAKKAEFIIVMLDLLDDVTYDNMLISIAG